MGLSSARADLAMHVKRTMTPGRHIWRFRSPAAPESSPASGAALAPPPLASRLGQRQRQTASDGPVLVLAITLPTRLSVLPCV